MSAHALADTGIGTLAEKTLRTVQISRSESKGAFLQIDALRELCYDTASMHMGGQA